jgi:hypothetical protein
MADWERPSVTKEAINAVKVGIISNIKTKAKLSILDKVQLSRGLFTLLKRGGSIEVLETQPPTVAVKGVTGMDSGKMKYLENNGWKTSIYWTSLSGAWAYKLQS